MGGSYDLARDGLNPAMKRGPTSRWNATDSLRGEGTMTDLGKQRRKQEAMTAVRHVEEALRRWDPIAGTPGAGAPADEYASYAPQIVSLLRGGGLRHGCVRSS